MPKESLNQRTSEKGFSLILILAAVAILGVLTISKVSSDNSNKSVLGVLVADQNTDSSGDSNSPGPTNQSGSDQNTPGSSVSLPGGDFYVHMPDVAETEAEKHQPEDHGQAEVSHESSNSGREQEKLNPLSQDIQKEIENARNKFINFSEKNGELQVEAQDASGSSRPLPFGATVTREATAGGQLITITVNTPNGVKTIVIKTSGGRLQIESDGLAADTSLPVSLNNSTHELTVTTPNGSKTLTVLPDEAANIATSSGIQNLVDKVDLNAGVSNDPVFTVDGFKSGRLFGLFEVSTPIQTQVDATTGQIVGVEQSLLSKLLSPFIR